jgi:hypothetical protein
MKKLILTLTFLLTLTGCSRFDPQAYVPGIETPAVPTARPETPPALRPSPSVEMATPEGGARVCTGIPGGKLHVRMAPGDASDVRGYLREGEAVTLTGGQAALEDGSQWAETASPVAGWVNRKYLCSGALP